MALLAKPEETLLQHTENTLKVFKSIKESYPRVPEICRVEKFWEHLFYAIFFHDFGKAANGFQETFNKGGKWYRHEILSAGFISSLDLEQTYKDAIGLSIITHHKDIMELRERYQTYPSPPGKKRYEEKLSELENNFNELMSYYSYIPALSKRYLGYELKNFTLLNSVNDLTDVYKDIVIDYLNDWEEDKKTRLHGKYGIFLKGFLNACDHLASGSIYRILQGIPDMHNIYQFSTLRYTQQKAFDTVGDAFLTAPTGSGKTEAALFWSDRNQNSKKSRRVFYLLPYTASINAMYTRFKNDFNNDELVGVMHGKTTYFLYKIFSEEYDYVTAKYKAMAIRNLTKKIYRPYKILTPFQILKAFFGIRWFELQLAEMTNGLFILDEIHAYDAHTTALILEMLKILKQDYYANIFIMSATFPKFVKDLFKKELEIDTEISFEKKKLKEFTRHHVSIMPGCVLDNLDKIKSDIKNNKRVLVVCNTVSRAQDVFNRLSSMIKRCVLIHGKFMLRDRERIEKRLKDMDLLIGTQAIEVSLDIDYDVLYSEPAPIDALIQRFGRVNRKGWEKNRISPVYIFSEGSESDKYIYNVDLVRKTLDKLGDIELLKEDIIQKIVDEIYEVGYTGKDKENFNIVRKHFRPFYNRIVPFIHDRRSEDDFYSLYQSYEVIPLQFKPDYLNEIERERYLEALSYFTSITKRQFNKLNRDNRVEKEHDTYFINAKYSNDLGLILDERELGLM